MPQFQIVIVVIALVALWTLQQIKGGLYRIADTLSVLLDEDDEVKED